MVIVFSINRINTCYEKKTKLYFFKIAFETKCLALFLNSKLVV